MHPLAYARGSVTLAESTRLLPSRDRQGAVSSEIPKKFKNTASAAQPSLQPGAANLEAMCFPAVAVLLFAQASSTGVNAQKAQQDRKSTRLNSSHLVISYA